MVVSLKRDKTASAKQILTSKIYLRWLDEEVTVFRFSLDEYKSLVTGSAYDLPRPLRAAKKYGG